MATLTIRNLPDETRDKLRLLAARNGRSMEAEARVQLARAVVEGDEVDAERRRERLRSAQQRVARHVLPGSYSVEQFLKERRDEASAEEAKWDRLERDASKAGPRSAR
jgi:plasmid stability protein